MSIIKVGLKANAAFLFKQTNGNNLGGTTGGIFHRFIIHFNNDQFEHFKKLILILGYSVDKSLVEDDGLESGCNYSCYLSK
jgi:hypothetical protein